METILIHSYKGGTGKTTIALNIAGLLAKKARVLLVENDFMMPCFFSIFNYEPKVYFNDYFTKKASLKETIVKQVKPRLDVIFVNKTFNPDEKVMSSDQQWFIQTLERMVKDFDSIKRDYDYIIFDTPPGWHLILINLIILSNKALLLLRPSQYAVEGTLRMIEILYKRAKPIRNWSINLLFNQIPQVDMKAELQQWVREFEQEGINVVGEIPCSCETAYEMAHEVRIFPEDHKFNQALKKALVNIF